MDDDDEFGDIPDEDLILALTQATETTTTKTVKNAPAAQRNNPTPANRPPTQNQRNSSSSTSRPSQRSSTQQPQQNYRQTTLWGNTIQNDHGSQSQTPAAISNRPFRVDLPPEAPTHHEIDRDAMRTWVYPLNLGPIRDYQFSIVKNGLFNNTLVALPTGLGKTFIAATIILNYWRWTKSAKIIFVAPTKPLASQQVQACLAVAGIPRSQATLLTGETSPALREGEWANKRLFFMTPQTLMNDLSKGYADPKSIVLLVIDEAHRATGDYAYVKVVEFMRRFSKSFRVLALTATPGSSDEAVQAIIDNLGISHIEIRTEESLDIRQYVHSRNTDTITFDPSEEMNEVRDLFSKALKPLVTKLTNQNVYYGRDPMSLTTYGLLQAKKEWLSGPGRHANQGVKFATMAVFSILQSLAHSIKLLNFHGIKPFYSNLAEFRNEVEEKGAGGSKLKKQVLNDENFQKMMSMIEGWMKLDGFTGHPKVDYLCETLVNHFLDAGNNSNTRAIVFSEYRDSAEEIVRVLNKQPLVKATVFVGQADSKRSEGMKQKQQIETIEKFKAGDYNVLVATSIGEEGLDIGQVDLIVCYDASASPIRMLQRMGRTGRKRAGNIVLLLMKGKEEEKFMAAKDNYQAMQRRICEGTSFAFRHDISTRIVPRDIKPEVDKRLVEIPLENSQNPGLPEPKKPAAGTRKKASKKKFNMPDGVETGFVKASMFGQPMDKFVKKVAKPKPSETDRIAEPPDLLSVVLSKAQTGELNRLYRDLPFRQAHMEEISAPNFSAYPIAQRTPRRTVNLKHGEYTKRCVRLFKTLGKMQDPLERYTKPYGETDTTSWEQIPVLPFADALRRESDKNNAYNSATSAKKRSRPVDSKHEEELEGDASPEDPRPGKRRASGEKAGRKPAAPKSRAATTSRARKGANSRSRGGGLKRVGDHFEDMGDDCMRTSDMDETDGSDSGADLLGFVVGDDEATSSMRRPLSTSPTTPDLSSSLALDGKKLPRRTNGHAARRQATPEPVKEKPFFVPMDFAPTQETEGDDDDIPELPSLLSTTTAPAVRKTKPAPLMDLDSDDFDDDFDDWGGGGTNGSGPPGKHQPEKRRDEENEEGAIQQQTAAPAPKRRRTVLPDSDDDED